MGSFRIADKEKAARRRLLNSIRHHHGLCFPPIRHEAKASKAKGASA
jgi:hypothetical protein